MQVAAVIIAIATYVLYNIIDETLTEKSAQIGLEKTRAMMEKFGASEEDIEKTMASSAESMKKTGLKGNLDGHRFRTYLGFCKIFVAYLSCS
jgi:hypothetical protein